MIGWGFVVARTYLILNVVFVSSMRAQENLALNKGNNNGNQSCTNYISCTHHQRIDIVLGSQRWCVSNNGNLNGRPNGRRKNQLKVAFSLLFKEHSTNGHLCPECKDNTATDGHTGRRVRNRLWSINNERLDMQAASLLTRPTAPSFIKSLPPLGQSWNNYHFLPPSCPFLQSEL